MNKKIIFIFILLLTLVSSTFNVFGSTEIIGKVLNTDIVAYINGFHIKSYNIEGYTGSVAEDLLDYGFDVTYNDEFRTLSIRQYIEDKEITANYNPEKNITKPIGSFSSNVYSTDITTKIYGDIVKSYNIGGKTIILIDSLSIFGDIKWYPKERKICFDYVPNWSLNIENDYNKDTSKNISNFILEIKRNLSGGFDINGQNNHYLTYVEFNWNKIEGLYFKFSIYGNVNIQTTELLEKLNNIANNNNLANDYISININDECTFINNVKVGGGNGHIDYYFYLDTEISNLDEIQSIRIECK